MVAISACPNCVSNAYCAVVLNCSIRLNLLLSITRKTCKIILNRWISVDPEKVLVSMYATSGRWVSWRRSSRSLCNGRSTKLMSSAHEAGGYVHLTYPMAQTPSLTLCTLFKYAYHGLVDNIMGRRCLCSRISWLRVLCVCPQHNARARVCVFSVSWGGHACCSHYHCFQHFPALLWACVSIGLALLSVLKTGRSQSASGASFLLSNLRCCAEYTVGLPERPRPDHQATQQMSFVSPKMPRRTSLIKLLGANELYACTTCPWGHKGCCPRCAVSGWRRISESPMLHAPLVLGRASCDSKTHSCNAISLHTYLRVSVTQRKLHEGTSSHRRWRPSLTRGLSTDIDTKQYRLPAITRRIHLPWYARDIVW